MGNPVKLYRDESLDIYIYIHHKHYILIYLFPFQCSTYILQWGSLNLNPALKFLKFILHLRPKTCTKHSKTFFSRHFPGWTSASHEKANARSAKCRVDENGRGHGRGSK
jgi:hypothetical protein